MRYTYKIIKDDGQTDEIEAMSYKKMLKTLSAKLAPNITVQVRYKNKKGHDLVKFETIKKPKD